MSANAFKISGILYNNMGTITINNHNYIIIANNIEFKIIEYKNNEGNIKYIFPNLNTADENELKTILFVNEITNSLKNEISSGNIKTKEELSNKIKKIMDLLNNDTYIKSLFNNNIDEFKSSIKGIYSYFDQKKEDNLDLSNITSFDIEENGITNSYIKRYDEDIKKDENITNYGIDEELLKADEIEKILTTKKESLTEEQIIMFEKLLEKKKDEAISSAGAGVNKRLALNLSGDQTPDDVDTKAAYVNLIALCMFVQISMLLIIIGTVYFMK